jgi:hypothetical protein
MYAQIKPADAARFLRQFMAGFGDYVEGHKMLNPPRTLVEIAEGIQTPPERPE